MESDFRSRRPCPIFIPLWVLFVVVPTAQGSAGEGVPCATARFSGFEQVRQEAERLASKPFEATEEPLPEALADIDRAEYESIRYERDKALWRPEGLPFQVEFYPRADSFEQDVRIYRVDDGCSSPVLYSPDLFSWQGNGANRRLPEDLGFAGFFILYPLNRPPRYDVLISFLGASYFRAVGRNQAFGASARGVAVDTGIPGKEQFPSYTAVWLRRPEPGDKAITVDALMQGRSVCGAFRYVVRPGDVTVVDAETSLFLRASVERFGAAPLTSMYLRSQVHDSDGLLIAGGSGGWNWRPLEDPEEVRITRFAVEDPRGFGLFQRDRDPAHYEHPGDEYPKRPSVWVEPLGRWGQGAVVLIELPSDTSNEDNMVAFWEPARPARAGAKFHYSYRLHYTLGEPSNHRTGTVLGTRGSSLEGGVHRFVIDFGLRGVGEEGGVSAPRAVARAVQGDVSRVTLAREGSSAGEVWRMSFDVKAEGKEPVELTAFLRKGDQVQTEIWSYTWRP